MKPNKQASDDSGEEISLPGSPRPPASSSTVAEDEISGVFRFLCDYRLTTPPSPLSRTAPSACEGSPSVSGGSSVSRATGASMVTSGGVGAPPHNHTPMGSTTKLISDPRPPHKEWRCLPGFGSVMVALSLATSLANIIRLPTMVFLHGGGSFLAIYIALAVVFGIPLVFLEVLLGQFSQEGTTKLWRAVPLLKGVGFLKVLACVLAAIYYPVFMAIALFYVVWAAKGPLPLPECKYLPYQTQGGLLRRTYGEACLEHTLLSQPDQDPTWFGVNIALLFIIWVLVMLCLCRDGRSYRVSAFLLLTAAVAALVALFTEQLGFNIKGLDKLLNIDINTLLNFETWYYAAVQLFLSTHLGFGNITTASGRIYAKSNAFWITLVYMACNLAVGVGFTCLVFMWMSRLEDQGITVASPRVPELFVLTFMYDVISRSFTYDVQLWAIIAFLAVLFAGLSSMMALVFTVTTTVIVESKERWKQWVITAGFCAICFLAGIICLLPDKLELVHMLEHYVVTRIVLITTALELLGFVWIYGSHHLYTDFEFVLGYKLNFIWNILWFITPLLIILLQVWSLFALPLTGFPGKIDPEWLYVTGWSIFGASWMFFLIVAIWQIAVQVDYNICQKFVSSLKPSRNWGPVDPIQRHGWVVWREQSTLSGERDFTLKRRGTRDYTHSVRHAPSDTLGTRYYPTYSKHPEKSIHEPMNGTFSINSVPNYNATQTTDVNMRGVGAPYTVQLPEDHEIDHVCWRKDASSRSRSS
ncbi:sodium-dependent nutrient amino acid transporter 1-like [Macrosteles quadrilineatus]|uniref:sodium-dependent nutrient amino acid transporter 1-like n=1 Tax=Macrosteles quadrilineatus TaxID=74068 RepID=UPI0023E0C815|nr:sodium-dependent nutrient amino acid transporter 1-like [Macrosteles quadrilineatus]